MSTTTTITIGSTAVLHERCERVTINTPFNQLYRIRFDREELTTAEDNETVIIPAKKVCSLIQDVDADFVAREVTIYEGTANEKVISAADLCEGIRTFCDLLYAEYKVEQEAIESENEEPLES